jgi:HNH endonuclease/AP2 domain
MRTLRKGLIYDSLTGLFTRSGLVVGKTQKSGYMRLRFDGKLVAAHRLAFLFMTDAWPPEDTDHINGVRHDNRWANLRAVSTLVNTQNLLRARCDNRSGLLGATWHEKTQRWRAQIRVKKSNPIYLGSFRTAEEAHACYLAAKRELHEGCTI